MQAKDIQDTFKNSTLVNLYDIYDLKYKQINIEENDLYVEYFKIISKEITFFLFSLFIIIY